jgi:hypothetical protein
LPSPILNPSPVTCPGISLPFLEFGTSHVVAVLHEFDLIEGVDISAREGHELQFAIDVRKRHPNSGTKQTLAVSPDGRWIAAGGSGGFRVFDMQWFDLKRLKRGQYLLKLRLAEKIRYSNSVLVFNENVFVFNPRVELKKNVQHATQHRTS